MSESAVPQHLRPLHRGQVAICWQGGGVGAAKNRGQNVRDWARNCHGLGIIFIALHAVLQLCSIRILLKSKGTARRCNAWAIIRVPGQHRPNACSVRTR